MFIIGDASFLQELLDVFALIALELDDLSVLRVVHYRTITGKLLANTN
jgi:hypothetical protein